MNTEEGVIKNAGLAANTVPSVCSQTQMGNGALQAGYIENVNFINNMIAPTVPYKGNGRVIDSGLVFSREFYNLFVVGGEVFDGVHFTIAKECALTAVEGVAPEITKRFAGLDDGAVSQIKTFPSLFMDENRWCGRTDPDHKAFFGVVYDVIKLKNEIKIYFEIVSSLPQQRLNELADNLALKRAPRLNELNRTHWAIKRVDLFKELLAAGFGLFGFYGKTA